MSRTRYPRPQGTIERTAVSNPGTTPVNTRSRIGPDGQRIVYLSRRLLPLPSQVADQSVYVVKAGDRIDTVAGRLLGDPLLYWQLADANGAMDPTELCAVPGRRLRVPAPLGQAATALDQPKAAGSTAAAAPAHHTDDDDEG